VLIGRQERTVPEWARQPSSGLEVGARGGIAVNQEMMASSKVCTLDMPLVNFLKQY
jgi:hypothetical protein